MNNPYSDNPFDAIYAAPVPIQGSSSSHTSPSQQQQQQQQQAAALDDLINPFAVLGMENKSQKSPTAVSSPYYQASGAGYTSPYAEASSAALYSPSHGPQQQQQQQQEWGMPSARSAFQPPAPIVTFQPYSPSVSPAFGSSPSSAYGQASPTQGTYSPASPAFHSGLHTGQGSPYAAASPFSFDGGSPYGNNSSNGDNKPNVTDADLSLFAGPVEATNAAAVGPSPSSPPPQQQQQQQQEVGASPAADDGWDIDDFGISWEAPEVAVAPTADAADADAAVPVQREQLERQEEEAVPAPESPPRNVSAPRGKKVSAIEAAIMAEHKMEGNVLARISVRTLIVKEWKETYWVIHHGKVLLYRSKEDYLYNPIGVMVKKDIPLRCNLRCSEVTCKPYKGYGDLYHFTLEEIFEYGPSLVAKFASSDVKGIRELRAVIVAYIIAERKKRGGGGRRSPVGPQGRSSAFANQERGRHQLPSPVQPRQASPRRGGGSPKMASGASMASGAGGQDKYAKWGQIS